MPCDNHYLRAIVTQRPNYAVNRTDYLGRDIEAELTRLLEKYILLPLKFLSIGK